jgi:hypothetical protein
VQQEATERGGSGLSRIADIERKEKIRKKIKKIKAPYVFKDAFSHSKDQKR